ncbi:MAG: LppX_LprAFG lipoprotein, partial [Nocardioides sp.]|nr:LppX_LprAFG lipoprotein [Nocardioides sp.]
DDVEKGDQTRGGANNDEVLNEYSGTLEGDLVKVLIPLAADDEFDVTYQITSDSELRQMAVTGEFYEGTGDMTYVVDFDNYGAEADIKAP